MGRQPIPPPVITVSTTSAVLEWFEDVYYALASSPLLMSLGAVGITLLIIYRREVCSFIASFWQRVRNFFRTPTAADTTAPTAQAASVFAGAVYDKFLAMGALVPPPASDQPDGYEPPFAPLRRGGPAGPASASFQQPPPNGQQPR